MEMAPQSAVRSGERWHLHGRTRKLQEELRGSRFPTSSALVPVDARAVGAHGVGLKRSIACLNP